MSFALRQRAVLRRGGVGWGGSLGGWVVGGVIKRDGWVGWFVGWSVAALPRCRVAARQTTSK